MLSLLLVRWPRLKDRSATATFVSRCSNNPARFYFDAEIEAEESKATLLAASSVIFISFKQHSTPLRVSAYLQITRQLFAFAHNPASQTSKRKCPRQFGTTAFPRACATFRLCVFQEIRPTTWNHRNQKGAEACRHPAPGCGLRFLA
jgi:hypothetical protein